MENYFTTNIIIANNNNGNTEFDICKTIVQKEEWE